MKLRSSGITTFLGCPRKYEIRYELGYEPVHEDPVLTFGQAMHQALECRAKGGTLAEQRVAFNKRASSLREHQRVVGECLLIAYNAKYESEGFTYEKVEEAFEARFGDHIFGGRFDAVILDGGGQRWILDHKTTRSDISEGAPYWAKRDLDYQIDGYLAAAQSCGLAVQGFIYDVIRVPQLKPRKATPKDKQQFYKRDGKYGKKGEPKPGTRLRPEGMGEFRTRVMTYIKDNHDSIFKREKFLVEDRDLSGVEDDICGVAYQIEAPYGKHRPRNFGHCLAFNRECEYKPVCRKETNLDNETLYKINPNPLEY